MQLAKKIIIADDHPLFRAALKQAVAQAYIRAQDYTHIHEYESCD